MHGLGGQNRGRLPCLSWHLETGGFECISLSSLRLLISIEDRLKKLLLHTSHLLQSILNISGCHTHSLMNHNIPSIVTLLCLWECLVTWHDFYMETIGQDTQFPHPCESNYKPRYPCYSSMPFSKKDCLGYQQQWTQL